MTWAHAQAAAASHARTVRVPRSPFPQGLRPRGMGHRLQWYSHLSEVSRKTGLARNALFEVASATYRPRARTSLAEMEESARGAIPLARINCLDACPSASALLERGGRSCRILRHSLCAASPLAYLPLPGLQDTESDSDLPGPAEGKTLWMTNWRKGGEQGAPAAAEK